LTFPVRNAKVEELIDWVVGKVRSVSDTVWQQNDNFVVLAIEGVLNMLNDAGCQELSQLHRLATSNDASVIENIPSAVRKLVRRLVRRWWKNHGLPVALHQLEASLIETVSFIFFEVR
jgi:hypothetical protein